MANIVNKTISNNIIQTQEQHLIDDDLTFKLPFAPSLPTAGPAYLYKMVIIPGTASTADTVYVCLKSAVNTYSWKTVIGG